MEKQNIKYCLLLWLFSFYSCQNNKECFDLRENAIFDSIPAKSIESLSNDVQQSLNYTEALLGSWKLVKNKQYLERDPNCVSCTTPNSMSISSFRQVLSFCGDNKNIISITEETEDQGVEIAEDEIRKRIKFYSAEEYILKQFENHQIIMFNEAHDRVQTRAFFLSMLPALKKAGATCLAMEALDQKGNLKTLDGTTGYYTCEPVMGQIIREALRLNFKLIAYEDVDMGIHSSNQIDSIQAKNIFQNIATETGIEKTVVLAGYGHISEVGFDLSTKFMAMWFKQMTKIDPLTVSQTDFIEASYLNMIMTGPVKIIDKTDIKIFDSGLLSHSDIPFYDLYVCHPYTLYIHNRPSWLVTSKDMKFVSIEIPDSIKPVLIQAYLSEEIKSDEDYSLKIPCDQTFESEYGKAWLVLNDKLKYNVVFRDQYNNIIHKIVKGF